MIYTVTPTDAGSGSNDRRCRPETTARLRIAKGLTPPENDDLLSELAISLSPSATCLGVCFNEHMKWDSHVDALTSKWYAVISSLRRLRQVGATMTVLLKAYRALFEPILGYCIAVWGGGYDTVMSRVRVLQNDALRALFGRKRRDSVRDLYLLHDILTVDQLIAVKRAG